MCNLFFGGKFPYTYMSHEVHCGTSESHPENCFVVNEPRQSHEHIDLLMRKKPYNSLDVSLKKKRLKISPKSKKREILTTYT